MSEYQHVFGTCVTSHSWNKDRSLLAMCPNDNTVRIVRAGTWEEVAVLDKHDQTITAIDWAPDTDRLATASQDRNCYVWEQEGPKDGTQWKASLVLVGLSRAATCIKWSPKQDKFAVGSGESNISICTLNGDFGTEGAWTSSKVKKRISSTVLSVAWHPNNIMLIAGCADCTARVFNCYVKDLDGKKPQGTQFFGIEPCNKKLTVSGRVPPIAEYECSSWVHMAKFNPSGTGLAFIGHDSSVHFVPVPSDEVQDIHSLPRKDDSQMQSIKTKGLPYKDFEFLEDDHLVAVGHDAVAEYFTCEGGQWVYKGAVEKPSWIEAGGAKKKNKVSAFKAFQDIDTFGKQEVKGRKLKSLHQNAIAETIIMDGEKFSTCGYDGRIVIWDSKCLADAKMH